jgi:hypothetical protein
MSREGCLDLRKYLLVVHFLEKQFGFFAALNQSLPSVYRAALSIASLRCQTPHILKSIRSEYEKLNQKLTGVFFQTKTFRVIGRRLAWWATWTAAAC